MDVEGREDSALDRTTATVLALVALGIDVLIELIPWFGTSFLSIALSGPPAVLKLAGVVSLLAGDVVLILAIVLLRRGRSAFAAGLLVALGALLAARVVSGLLQSTQGWMWETFAYLALAAIETALLFLAASLARREEPTAS